MKASKRTIFSYDVRTRCKSCWNSENTGCMTGLITCVMFCSGSIISRYDFS